MKYIKFSFTDKKLNISIPFDKAEAVMNSPETIVRVTDRSGKWTGQTVNKSLLMGTDVDWEATRQSDMEEGWKATGNLIEGPEVEPIDAERRKEIMGEWFPKEKKTLDPEKLKEAKEELKQFNVSDQLEVIKENNL